jgi:hypothetical protein
MYGRKEKENQDLTNQLGDLINNYGSEKILTKLQELDPDVLKEYEREIGSLRMQLHYSRLY